MTLNVTGEKILRITLCSVDISIYHTDYSLLLSCFKHFLYVLLYAPLLSPSKDQEKGYVHRDFQLFQHHIRFPETQSPGGLCSSEWGAKALYVQHSEAVTLEKKHKTYSLVLVPELALPFPRGTTRPVGYQLHPSLFFGQGWCNISTIAAWSALSGAAPGLGPPNQMYLKTA